MSEREPSQRILLMRHPETVANTIHFYSGRRDVNLTERGELQRQRAVRALIAWEPDRIWCSPLSRCLSIAAPAAEVLGVEVVLEDRLAEIDFGSAEGLTVEQFHELGYEFPWPVVDGRSQVAPGGESFEALVERGREVLGALAGFDGRTACVTHGGFTRALLAAAFDIDISRYWNLVSIDNVSSQVLSEKNGEYCLRFLGLSPEEVMRRMEDGSIDEGMNVR